jgi:hypothetical protein
LFFLSDVVQALGRADGRVMMVEGHRHFPVPRL